MTKEARENYLANAYGILSDRNYYPVSVVINYEAVGLSIEEIATKFNMLTQDIFYILENENVLRVDEDLNFQYKRLKKLNTPLNCQIRACSKYRLWRISVLTRDSYLCQLCNNKTNMNGIQAHADHIYPFIKIIRRYNIQSLEEAMKCKDLWCIDNGRCLCGECHRKTNTWGTKAIKQHGENIYI